MSNVECDNCGHLNLFYILYKGPRFSSLLITLTMVRVSIILVIAVFCIVASANPAGGGGGKPGGNGGGKPEGNGEKPNKGWREN